MRRVMLATLLSSLTLIATAAPVTHSEDDASAPTSRLISTGVTSPRLVYSKHIDLPADELPAYMGGSAKIALKIKLDETGSPTNIRVLHSINPEVDARVVEAVQQQTTTAMGHDASGSFRLGLVVPALCSGQIRSVSS